MKYARKKGKKSAMGTGTWHILKTIKICTENKELFGFLCNIL
jgi:hypothetical protein